MGVSELDYARIGQRIRETRNAKGWPQSEFAFREGLNSAYVSHIETGQTKLALPTIVLPMACLLRVRLSTQPSIS